MEATGGQVIAIAAQSMKPVQRFADMKGLPFPIGVDDRERSVIKSYGVYRHLGLDAYRIAWPATFVVGQDRRLTFARRTRKYDRTSAEQLADLLCAAAEGATASEE